MPTPDAAPLDRIRIHDLRLRCIIGVLEWERHTVQEVRVNVVLQADLASAGQSDRLEETIDYAAVSQAIIALAEQSCFLLVETLAERIAGLCLAYPRVCRVKVSVKKPGAVRFARWVGVTLRRRRSL
ncbi:MAG: dihydroneopterin aldolase [Magnetococcales bacterium]|nr:dihydroneopterin aldolase [Magnetococcales bacterium]